MVLPGGRSHKFEKGSLSHILDYGRAIFRNAREKPARQ